jgi:hypothetical protein
MVVVALSYSLTHPLTHTHTGAGASAGVGVGAPCSNIDRRAACACLVDGGVVMVKSCWAGCVCVCVCVCVVDDGEKRSEEMKCGCLWHRNALCSYYACGMPMSACVCLCVCVCA